ncbi:MAG: hypothetical protein KBC11_00215 [Candidatus Pacebacteria bacterium]|nr:hypothetical protein [Candidatus Paceibacterota bacterium]
MNRKSLHVNSEAFKRLMKTLKENDDSRYLAVLLRFHLLIEYYLDLIISVYLKKGVSLLDNNLSFSQKLSIVDSFDLVPENIILSIKKLNSVRNKAAHDMDYIITERDVDSIGRCYGNNYIEFAKTYLGRDRKNDDDPAYFEAFLYNVFTLIISEISYVYENLDNKTIDAREGSPIKKSN